MPQYWVVGATYGGHEDQAPRFMRHGFWTLGYTEHGTEENAPDQVRLRDQIQEAKGKQKGTQLIPNKKEPRPLLSPFSLL